MADSSPGRSAEVELLRALCARFDTGTPPTAREVELALELGFANLLALEARLRLDDDAFRRDRITDPPGPSRRLMEQIDTLRGVLSDLRSRTHSQPASPLAAGFVLPREALS